MNNLNESPVRKHGASGVTLNPAVNPSSSSRNPQETVRRYGASREEWQHFDWALGLTADLLPVVCDPHATISPNSNMKSVGKTPSIFNGNRHVVGIPQWTQQQSTDDDVERWMKEQAYGICIQTRSIRAIDVDVDDAELAQEIHAYISARFNLPERYRANASKFLLAFDLSGELGKRKFQARSGIVEFLATGQQFVACGIHVSGSSYQWRDGLPDHFPTLTLEQFDQLWSELHTEFGIGDAHTSSASTKTKKLADVVSSDPIANFLFEQRLVKSAGNDGKLHIDCPWKEDHSMDSGDSETCYYPAHTGGYANGHFKCLHAHCESRDDSEFLEMLGYTAADALADFDVIAENPATPATPETSNLKFKFQSAYDFTQHASPRWIVKGVLPEAQLAVVYGDSGSGKTFFMLDLAGAIARGTEWRGRTVRKGRVAYVVAEGAGGFRNRLKAYAHQHQVDLKDIDIVVLDAAPNMLEKSDAVEVSKAILAAGGADIVVLDTFAQVMAGANENSGEDVGKALAHCKGINRATKALVVLIHHSGKDASKGARGWSGLRAAADVEIEINRAEDHRAATVTKLKDGEDGSEFGFRLHTVVVGMDEDEEEITSCVLEHNDAGRPKHAKALKSDTHKVILEILRNRDNYSMRIDDLRSEITKVWATHIEDKSPPRSDSLIRSINSFVDLGYIKMDGLDVVLSGAK